MSSFRLVNQSFWTDDVVAEKFSAEEKYFFLYLITNPNSHQCGVSHLPTRVIAFETGLEKRTVEILLEKFENKYKKIVYNYETQEIAILNFLKHNVVKGGTPFEDCLESGLSRVVDSSLAAEVYKHVYDFMSNEITIKKAKDAEAKAKNANFDSKSSKYEGVKKIFERYFQTIGYDIYNELNDIKKENVKEEENKKEKEDINNYDNENKNKRDVQRVVPILADKLNTEYTNADDDLPF